MRKGMYICFEGGDGCGKSTLATAVHERFGLRTSVPARFPSDGIIGTLIREGLMGKRCLEDKPFLYLFAADGLQQEILIDDVLNAQGKHIICDRHPTLSGRAFQPIHHNTREIEDVYNAAARDGISMPDYLFVLQVPAEVAIQRMKAREKYVDVVFEKNDIEYIETIAARYRLIAESFGGIILDGTKSIDELVGEVMDIVGPS